MVIPAVSIADPPRCPSPPSEIPTEAITAAHDLERPWLPAALILSISWFESNYRPTAGPQTGVMQVTLKDLDGRSIWWLRQLAIVPEHDSPVASLFQGDQYSGMAAGIVELEQHQREMHLDPKAFRQNITHVMLRRACGSHPSPECSGRARRLIACELQLERDIADHIQ